MPLTNRSVCCCSHTYQRVAQGPQPGAAMTQQGGVAEGWERGSGGRDVWTHKAEPRRAAETKGMSYSSGTPIHFILFYFILFFPVHFF